jgi:hypothetical protein
MLELSAGNEDWNKLTKNRYLEKSKGYGNPMYDQTSLPKQSS